MKTIKDEIPQPGAGDGVPPDGGSAAAAAAAAEGEDEAAVSSPPPSPKKKKRKRDGNALRKAPQAPKRFKSSYIMYFTAKQDETKAALTKEAEERGEEDVRAATTVTEISRRSADNWKHLPADERAYWEEEAAKDKERFMREKESYTGPWQVPKKRAKKDPAAPKRPMSAFLFYSQERRKMIKAKNPGMKNTEVSVVLGEMWREASDEEKRPHKEIEEKERAKYKIKIAKWNKEKKERDEALKKEQEEQQRQFAAMQPPAPPTQAPTASAPQAGGPYAMPPSQAPPPPMQADPSQQEQQQQNTQQQQQPLPPPQSYDPNMMYQHPPPYGMPPPSAYPYHMYPPPPHGYYAPYPPPPPASAPNGQPVILGPNGMPQGAPPLSPQEHAPHQQHHMYMHPPQHSHSMPPHGHYPPPYGAPPPPQPQQHQEHHLQQQQQQQVGIPAAPPAHQVFNEDGNGNPMMPSYPPYPEPEQLMGGQMPYPPQE